MSVLDCGPLVGNIRMEVADMLGSLHRSNVIPKLGIILSPSSPKTLRYTQSLVEPCQKIGLEVRLIEVPEAELAHAIRAWGDDATVHGILVLTPSPDAPGVQAALDLIPPAKDIDGRSCTSVGRLITGQRAFFAPTEAQAVMEILRHHNITLRGARAMIHSRNTVTDLCLAALLARQQATVAVCDLTTSYLRDHGRNADIIVVDTERPHSVGAQDIRPKSVVIDMGRRDDDGEPQPNVRTGEVSTSALVTHVPLGVSVVQSALRIRNTVVAASRQHRRLVPSPQRRLGDLKEG